MVHQLINMKKQLLLLCLFVGTTFASLAQLKKGEVVYSMNISSENPEMAMVSSMMAGSTMTMLFMPGKSRVDIAMGMMGNMSTISDQKKKKSLALVDMMGMKYATETKLEDQPAEDNGEQNIEITTETKDILGYNCTKAIVTSEGTIMTIWFTKDIEAFTNGQQYHNSKIPGFPLSMSIFQNDMNIDMVATEVKKTVSKKAFSMKVPEGYEMKSAEDLQMMGGGAE